MTIAFPGESAEYLTEVGQATGMLEGRFARKQPEDLPG